MYTNDKPDNTVIMVFNAIGVAAAYVLLGMSLWLSTDVPLSTKGFWGIAVLLLTLSLVNFVKYRFENQARVDRINRIEEAKNEKILEDFVGDTYGPDRKDAA